MTRRRTRITLDDVAREAGVSTMTVSRVINNSGRISDATRERVREVIARLDYRPSRAARALVTSRTMMIAAVVPDITNPYFSEIVQGIESVAWEQGYSVLLVNTDETLSRERAALGQLEDSTVDGLIVCSPRLPDDELNSLLARHRFVVTTNRIVPEHLASVVIAHDDLLQRALRGVDHLVASGRRRIAYFPLRRTHGVEPADYLAGLEARGLEADPAWCVVCAPTWEAGYAAGKALLLEHPELDAAVGGNDLVALGVMRAALELGRRIPDDLAIVGGDDILLASQVTPSLTTFRVLKVETGQMAAQLLFKRMAGDTRYREHRFTEEFIRRDSAP
ncbi:MAG TPA: LacI family DNA-binding transcriptional regulator [Aggregatilinea sp.]|jgi:LacI family transcriptional regulator|uniref:LacI family DNA-binding transcriptional regulator n=1 Tax=Aggregatilinea sp. TaxID=2806333 RepID=UPI002B6ACA85|nr:LacI family DNA-binding transcriptional regulator [Aggregatilinea sp.]HML20674.1 LacI family DNA-binding transcriptional regulator [Aggregatilinea sp.]